MFCILLLFTKLYNFNSCYENGSNLKVKVTLFKAIIDLYNWFFRWWSYSDDDTIWFLVSCLFFNNLKLIYFYRLFLLLSSKTTRSLSTILKENILPPYLLTSEIYLYQYLLVFRLTKLLFQQLFQTVIWNMGWHFLFQLFSQLDKS